jgi:hypothetical protein
MAESRNSGGGWLEDLLSLMKRPRDGTSSKAIGDVWSSTSAEKAFSKGEMSSKDAGGAPLRVAFRNKSRLPLILSWVDRKGKCHHFYTLKPAEILEGPVTALEHTENTFVGDSFCIAHVGDKKEEEKVRESKNIDPRCIIGGYRPLVVPKDRPLVVPEGSGEDNKERNGKSKHVHLVSISQQPAKKLVCCAPAGHHLRGSTMESGNDFDDLCWVVQAEESTIDETQLDTSKKCYVKSVLGGWPVFVEPDWHGGNLELERIMADDLEWAAKRLPPHAREYLMENTPVWINKSLCWGPEVCPVNGRGLCFHPGSDYLQENMMHKEKCYCVEMYNANEYLKTDRPLWGRGGVLIHEFSHAYHHRMLEKGYDNPEILDCFEKAMEDKLYNWVRVKGRQGPMNNAYAGTNAMEYFAELSAAFLGQPDMQSEEEFNKWYPFNRRHVKEHDPRAYQLLKKLWKVSED